MQSGPKLSEMNEGQLCFNTNDLYNHIILCDQMLENQPYGRI